MKGGANAIPLKQTPASKIKPTYKAGPGSGRRAHAAKGSHDGGGHGDGTWIFSYADMITILMTFFILMLSISNVSSEKFDELKEAMKSDQQNAPATEKVKSVKVSAELQKLSGEKGPQLAGIPLDAVAKKAAETGGDRLAQLTAGMRILLESVNKEFIEREVKQMAEFEKLRNDVSQISKVAEGRSESHARAAEIAISLPADEVFTLAGRLAAQANTFLKSVVDRSRGLENKPNIRLEVHTSRHWKGKPRSEQETLGVTAQQGGILLGELISLGVDPALVVLGAYGSRKPLVAEIGPSSQELESQAQHNRRVLIVLERRPLDGEIKSGRQRPGLQSGESK